MTSNTKALANTTAVAVIKSPPITAEPPKAKLPTLPLNTHWEMFAELERDADFVLEIWQDICDPESWIKDPHAYLVEIDLSHMLKNYRKTRAYFDKELEPYVDPPTSELPELYDGKITKEAISARIGLLMDYFPNGKPPNPEVYLRTMACHIRNASPQAYVVESACREAELTCKWSPVLAEFMPILLKQKGKLWNKRRCAIDYVETSVGNPKKAAELAAHLTRTGKALAKTARAFDGVRPAGPSGRPSERGRRRPKYRAMIAKWK